MRETDEFIRSFREIQPKFSRVYARILMEADLTLPQYALLNQLVDRGTLTMTEVSAKLHITKPAVTSLVDRLEKNKFLRRLTHPEDRRIFLLEIQPKGEKIVRTVQAYVLRLLLKTLGTFGLRERKTISRFYRLLSKIMDETLTPGKI